MKKLLEHRRWIRESESGVGGEKTKNPESKSGVGVDKTWNIGNEVRKTKTFVFVLDSRVVAWSRSRVSDAKEQKLRSLSRDSDSQYINYCTVVGLAKTKAPK